MFKLNKYEIVGSNEYAFLNGISLRNESSLVEGFFHPSNTNNAEFTNIKKLPDIKNADIKCDKLSKEEVALKVLKIYENN